MLSNSIPFASEKAVNAVNEYFQRVQTEDVRADEIRKLRKVSKQDFARAWILHDRQQYGAETF